MADLGPRRSGAVRRRVVARPRSRLAPGRFALALALLGSVAFIAYGFMRRDAAQIPIFAAGLIVLGLTLLAVGFWGAIAAYRDSRDGRSGRAFAEALVGGLLVVGGAAALAGALVLALIWESA